MTAYRFRVKFEGDPQALWRDVVVGEDRTLDEFQTRINEAVGLDQGHLWFFGRDRRYWSSEILFKCPREFGESAPSEDKLDELTKIVDDVAGIEDPDLGRDEDRRNAAKTTIADALSVLDGQRICYLYDYGDEWRFYALLKERLDSMDDDAPSQVVETKGEPVQQYAPPGEGGYR
ncbi:IS1096 element passenger TnpR family protein [Haloparvum sp. AD34]